MKKYNLSLLFALLIGSSSFCVDEKEVPPVRQRLTKSKSKNRLWRHARQNAIVAKEQDFFPAQEGDDALNQFGPIFPQFDKGVEMNPCNGFFETALVAGGIAGICLMLSQAHGLLDSIMEQ